MRIGSEDGLQTLVGDDIEQLERRAGGAGVALFPLTDGRSCGVQIAGEHRLAEFQVFAQPFDIGSAECPHGRRVDRVEFAHRQLADGACFVQCR